jgi:hypothetical protein
MVLMAHVGAENRAAIAQLEQRWKLGNAQTLRRLLVLGLGGSLQHADALNQEMARKRAAAEAHHKRARTLGSRELARTQLGDDAPPRAPTVSVRVPSNLHRQVKAQGGLRKVLERGLEVVDE